jgi:hypothetical protein
MKGGYSPTTNDNTDAVSPILEASTPSKSGCCRNDTRYEKTLYDESKI